MAVAMQTEDFPYLPSGLAEGKSCFFTNLTFLLKTNTSKTVWVHGVTGAANQAQDASVAVSFLRANFSMHCTVSGAGLLISAKLS